MKKITALTALALIVCALAMTGCKRGSAAASGGNAQQTQTIAPAAAQPAPTGTDAMTQTVEVEDTRSEDEGGALTNGASTAKTGTTSTTATTPAKAPAKAPAKPKKK